MSNAELETFPNITITMQGGAQLVVPPQGYWVELGGTAKQGTYQFGIQSSSSQFILGDVALEVWSSHVRVNRCMRVFECV